MRDSTVSFSLRVMNLTARPLLGTFVTGLLAALPLAATLLIVVSAVRLLYEWVGPDSLVGSFMIALGMGVAGSELVGYLLGVAIVIAGIFALGLAVRSGLRDAAARVVNGVVQRIPLVRGVYEMMKKIVDLMAQRDEQGTRSMSPVWLHFGGVGGAAVLGLLSSVEPVMFGERAYLAVLVPTAPVPVGGGLLYVPQEWVMPANVGMEGLTSIYVSMGITTQQHLGSQAGAAR